MDKKAKLLQTISISDRIMSDSVSKDKNSKSLYKKFSTHIKNLLQRDNPNSAALTSIANTILTQWNEGINEDTEIFWTELNKLNIDYKRKEPLRYALTKGRFINVHAGMQARKNWDKLKKLKSLQKRYSTEEITKLDDIIKADEIKRIDLLRKCLTKGKIPQTQYLSFGDSMAYISNCSLFDKYFTKDEVDKLYKIWKGFSLP